LAFSKRANQLLKVDDEVVVKKLSVAMKQAEQ